MSQAPLSHIRHEITWKDLKIIKMLSTMKLRPASAFLLSILGFANSFSAAQLVRNSVTLNCEYMRMPP